MTVLKNCMITLHRVLYHFVCLDKRLVNELTDSCQGKGNADSHIWSWRFLMHAWGFIGWLLSAPANAGLAPSSLSKLWGPQLIFNPVYSKLPRGSCALLSLSARIFVVVWPCLLPHTSKHCVSFTCLCWHRLVSMASFLGRRNCKQRMSDVNTWSLS